MIVPSGTITKIRLKPWLVLYAPIMYEFVDYILRVAELKFHVYGCLNGNPNDTFELVMDYHDRFSSAYQRGQISSFYQLQAWSNANPREVCLLTLTTHHGYNAFGQKSKFNNATIIEAMETLQTGWRKLSKILRKEIPGIDYVVIPEPHKSGYPHYHAILFTEKPIPESLQKKCQNLWEKKYGAGSAEIGVQFDFRKPDQPIKSIVNYLTKYIRKLVNVSTSKFPDNDKRNEMTAGRYVFYALAWKYGWRLILKSNRLSQIMKYRPKPRPVKDDDGNEAVIVYDSVELSSPVAGSRKGSGAREFRTVWERIPGTFNPAMSISRSMSDQALGESLPLII